jgi:hypothetical protein
VAVGGTGGYFPADGVNQGGAQPMPWNVTDSRKFAMESFWNRRSDWLNTWEDPTMQIKSIKIFQDDGIRATSDSTSRTRDVFYMCDPEPELRDWSAHPVPGCIRLRYI